MWQKKTWKQTEGSSLSQLFPGFDFQKEGWEGLKQRIEKELEHYRSKAEETAELSQEEVRKARRELNEKDSEIAKLLFRVSQLEEKLSKLELRLIGYRSTAKVWKWKMRFFQILSDQYSRFVPAQEQESFTNAAQHQVAHILEEDLEI